MTRFAGCFRFSLSILMAVPSMAPAQAGTTLPDRMDGAMHAAEAVGFSGAVLVARGHNILLDEGYGRIGKLRVSAHSKFWIASAGKQFTAAAIMKCRDKHLLKLNDSLSRFFPSAPADKRNITVRQLLSHTSGLDQTYASEGAADRQQAVARMLAHPLVDTPGHAFHYSNDNYQLAAAIVEMVSKKSYTDFVTRELFSPAGLQHTGFAGDVHATDVLPAKMATPARLAKSSWGAEGVYSTTGDLFRWYGALRDGHVLSRKSVGEMLLPVAKIREGAAGSGWFIGRSPRGEMQFFVRGNEDWGPNCLLYAYPRTGLVIVVLTHAGDANADLSWSRAVLSKLQAALNL